MNSGCDFISKNRIVKRLAAIALAAVLALPLEVVAASKLPETDERIEIINSVEELEQRDPQSEELSAYLDELMPTLFTDDMDIYEQLKACYDYIKDNTRYGSHTANLDAKIGGTTCRSIYRKYGEVEGFGAVALAAHTGMCNAYASAFILMARKLGFNAYLVKGQTKSRGGGYAYHEWCEININGRIYLFDPQLDQNLSSIKEYMVFCATYDEVPGRYRKY